MKCTRSKILLHCFLAVTVILLSGVVTAAGAKMLAVPAYITLLTHMTNVPKGTP
jgi:hypothetical protein